MPEAIEKKVASHRKLMPCCSYRAFVLKIKKYESTRGIFTSVK